MTTAVVVPFRDRGRDPLRELNMRYVMELWHDTGMPWCIASDGNLGGESFNRSAAYNSGVASMRKFHNVDVWIFAESDMIPVMSQIHLAVDMAREKPGLVIPFTEYRYLSPERSEDVRRGGYTDVAPEWVMGNGRSIGAINVVCDKTLRSIGRFDDGFSGNWFDDDAALIAFETCAGPTRWVEGPAFHLYHLPGHKGAHLTPEDRRDTAANKERLKLYEKARGNPAAIRDLTEGRV